MLCPALMASLGVFLLFHGEFNIPPDRFVPTGVARTGGSVLLIGAFLSPILGEFGILLQMLAVIMTFSFSLFMSEKRKWPLD